MTESFRNDSWDGGSPAVLHFESLVDQDVTAKGLAAARRAVLATPAQVIQEAHALFVPETPPASATLPPALVFSDAAAAASTLASADAVDQDPYYNLLAWEMRRVRSEYIEGAPPTYVSDPDSDTTSTGPEEAPLPAPVVLEPLRFTV
jgi:hypothetical protein